MLLTNAKLATLQNNDEFGIIDDGVIVLDGAHIAWVGGAIELPDTYRDQETRDLGAVSYTHLTLPPSDLV